MQQSDNRPRVFSCIPNRSGGRCEAAASHYALASRGAVEIIPGHSISPVLAMAHNVLWAKALDLAKAGIVTHWLCHHADIEVRTHGWLDIMVEEMARVGAAVLSVVQPIKDESGYTSTAVETGDPWAPQKLTLEDVAAKPETFTLQGLLVNTGLMLVDVTRPGFHETTYGALRFCFTINDRITMKSDGNLLAQFQPEDWNFSRQCHQAGLPVWATRKIECIHWGDKGWSNQRG